MSFDEKLQEVATFTSLEGFPGNFVVLSHEYYLEELDEYLEDGEAPPGAWISMEEWIQEILRTEGRMSPH